MTQDEKNRLQYMISVMQAYKDGKEIEVKWIDGKWRSDVDITWDWRCYDYRIKPEPSKPQYRPFENTKELMDAVKEHGDIVVGKGSAVYRKIIAFTPYDVSFGTDEFLEYKETYTNYVFADGTPFGKLIEE